MYREYQSYGLLAPYVDKIWEFKGSLEYGMRINVLPDGCTDLILALDGTAQPANSEGRIISSCCLFFVGPMKRCPELVAYTETVHVVGIRFHPHGLFRFTDLPVQEPAGRRVSSADLEIKLFDDSFTERLHGLPDLRSRIQCIEAVLVRSTYKRDVMNKQIVFVANHIHLYHDQREIRLLAEDACLCQRRLEWRFKLFIGFTPKECSRIMEFGQAIDLLKSTTEADNLLSVAVNTGYYDVSHFLKEVKTPSGGTAEPFLSPTLSQEGLLTYIEKWNIGQVIKETSFRKAFRIQFRVQALHRKRKIDYICKKSSLLFTLQKSFFYNVGVDGQTYICRDYQSKYHIQ